MNRLKPEIVAQIIALRKKSYTLRQIQNVTGANPMTVLKYCRAAGLDVLTCECGRNINHRGFCSVRFARCPGRQEWMERVWHSNSFHSLEQLAASIEKADRTYFGTN